MEQHVLGAGLQTSIWNDYLKKNALTAIQLNWAEGSLTNSISHFIAINQMQQSLAGNLPNLVARHDAKVDLAIASKNYGVQKCGSV